VIACQIEVNAVAIPDPAPPSGIVSPAREILIAQIVVASALTGRDPVAILVPGEALQQLIDLLQQVIVARPDLTTERLAAEGVAIRGKEEMTFNLVPGPREEQ